MEALRAIIEEIRKIRGVKPGEKSAPNEDYGELGQLLECLIYEECGSWQDVQKDEGLRVRVTATAKGYLRWLKHHRTP